MDTREVIEKLVDIDVEHGRSTVQILIDGKWHHVTGVGVNKFVDPEGDVFVARIEATPA